MFKVLVLDQFVEPSPYQLQQNPRPFAELIAQAEREPHALTIFTPPQVLEVDESFVPPYATTTLREGPDGRAEVWKMRWDSSG